MKGPVRFCLKIVSPVHIGCDETYEPMAFLVDEDSGKLVSFDPFEFVRNLARKDRDELTAICKKGTAASILEIYRFMRKRRFPGSVVDLCPGFLDHYQETLAISPRDTKKLQKELNNFSIARTAANPNTGRPFIPGSSIKGALRTAYLNARAATARLGRPGGRNAARELEERLLDGGKFETDPFRMLKVSDFTPVGAVPTRVIYAINRKKKPGKFEARGPYQILEVIEPGAVFEGWISVEEPMARSGIKLPLSLDSIKQSSRFFFEREINRENADLEIIGAEPVLPAERNGAFPVRLGRHSGAECVTVDGYRSIKIMQGCGQKDKFDRLATTLWLAANSRKPNTNRYLRPFGWAVLAEVSEELEQSFSDMEEKYQRGLLVSAYSIPAADSAADEDREEDTPAEAPTASEEIVREVWSGAHLAWSPGNQTLTASWEGKKATVTGKDLVPKPLHTKLFQKKKPVTAIVEVEPIGNAFRIVSIEES